MSHIFIAPAGYTLEHANPFTSDGKYDRSWTILTIDENVRGSILQQRSPYGCYAVSMTPNYAFFPVLFADFIQYEIDHGRKIILVSRMTMNLNFKTHYRETSIRPSDSRLLVHSTTLASYEKIVADNLLKSPNRLRAEGVFVHPIGLEPLGEPDDYLDYIMFGTGGAGSEIVVNSRLRGSVNYDHLAPYTPQARLYFDGHKMVSDGIIIRNAAIMVFDSVSLEKYLLKTVTADDLQLPNGDSFWTPFSFSKAADDLMQNFIA